MLKIETVKVITIPGEARYPEISQQDHSNCTIWWYERLWSSTLSKNYGIPTFYHSCWYTTTAKLFTRRIICSIDLRAFIQYVMDIGSQIDICMKTLGPLFGIVKTTYISIKFQEHSHIYETWNATMIFLCPHLSRFGLWSYSISHEICTWGLCY